MGKTEDGFCTWVEGTGADPHVHTAQRQRGLEMEAWETSAQGNHQNVETRGRGGAGRDRAECGVVNFLKPSFIWNRETAAKDSNLQGEGGRRDSSSCFLGSLSQV